MFAAVEVFVFVVILVKIINEMSENIYIKCFSRFSFTKRTDFITNRLHMSRRGNQTQTRTRIQIQNQTQTIAWNQNQTQTWTQTWTQTQTKTYDLAS